MKTKGKLLKALIAEIERLENKKQMTDAENLMFHELFADAQALLFRK